MGNLWETASNNPAGRKNTAMETSWRMHGNFMGNSGLFLGKCLWKLHGSFMGKSQQQQQVTKKQPWGRYNLKHFYFDEFASESILVSV